MQAPAPSEPWQARLTLRLSRRDDSSILSARSHSGPLQVQRPFYPEGPGICHIYLLHPPGGMVCSDCMDIDIQVDAGAKTLFTTPGAGKFYRSIQQHCARQRQHIQLASEASLEWLPQENIFYSGANCELLTRVELQENSRFIGWEINCLGRPASGEAFIRGRVRQRFELWHGDTPLWLERNLFAADSAALQAAWGLQGRDVCATLVCTANDQDLADEIRAAVSIDDAALFAVTQLDKVLVCRYLGDHNQAARRCLTTAWSILRPRILGKPASAPRIWNT